MCVLVLSGEKAAPTEPSSFDDQIEDQMNDASGSSVDGGECPRPCYRQKKRSYRTVHCIEGSFRPVFWDQQLQNSKKGDARQHRWHPLMIKWCLNLKIFSTYVKCCLSCHEVEWFCNTTIRTDSGGLYQLHQ